MATLLFICILVLVTNIQAIYHYDVDETNAGNVTLVVTSISCQELTNPPPMYGNRQCPTSTDIENCGLDPSSVHCSTKVTAKGKPVTSPVDGLNSLQRFCKRRQEWQKIDKRGGVTPLFNNTPVTAWKYKGSVGKWDQNGVKTNLLTGYFYNIRMATEKQSLMMSDSTGCIKFKDYAGIGDYARDTAQFVFLPKERTHGSSEFHGSSHDIANVNRSLQKGDNEYDVLWGTGRYDTRNIKTFPYSYSWLGTYDRNDTLIIGTAIGLLGIMTCWRDRLGMHKKCDGNLCYEFNVGYSNDYALIFTPSFSNIKLEMIDMQFKQSIDELLSNNKAVDVMIEDKFSNDDDATTIERTYSKEHKVTKKVTIEHNWKIGADFSYSSTAGAEIAGVKAEATVSASMSAEYGGSHATEKGTEETFVISTTVKVERRKTVSVNGYVAVVRGMRREYTAIIVVTASWPRWRMDKTMDYQPASGEDLKIYLLENMPDRPKIVKVGATFVHVEVEGIMFADYGIKGFLKIKCVVGTFGCDDEDDGGNNGTKVVGSG